MVDCLLNTSHIQLQHKTPTSWWCLGTKSCCYLRLKVSDFEFTWVAFTLIHTIVTVYITAISVLTDVLRTTSCNVCSLISMQQGQEQHFLCSIKTPKSQLYGSSMSHWVEHSCCVSRVTPSHTESDSATFHQHGSHWTTNSTYQLMSANNIFYRTIPLKPPLWFMQSIMIGLHAEHFNPTGVIHLSLYQHQLVLSLSFGPEEHQTRAD